MAETTLLCPLSISYNELPSPTVTLTWAGAKIGP